jgi:hypothetical protein
MTQFKKKKLFDYKFVFQVSLKLLSETFFTQRISKGDMIENVYWVTRKVPVILV